MKWVSQCCRAYTQLPATGKILVWLAIMCFVVFSWNSATSLRLSREGMTPMGGGSGGDIISSTPAIYDTFYANIYDQLFANPARHDFELANILRTTRPNETSVVLDIGCGTGCHVAKLRERGIQAIGIDVSPAMIAKAKNTWPDAGGMFMVADAQNQYLFDLNKFTHILALYFTIYYFQDKRAFFDNCMDWLKSGGWLVVHLVDPANFDPMLPAANPLLLFSPQRYAKSRITQSRITFDNFKYSANFEMPSTNEPASFFERFRFHDGTIRRQTHQLYMEPVQRIVNTAQSAGFILRAEIDMLPCAYGSQYMYVFQKP